ncbi:MAG: hypothetical protein AAGI25_18375 [Bacteroidota bacterium]
MKKSNEYLVIIPFSDDMTHNFRPLHAYVPMGSNYMFWKVIPPEKITLEVEICITRKIRVLFIEMM